jgi:alpha-mannosidase
MNFKTLARCLSAFLLAAGPAALAADSPPDLTKDHVVYLIGYSHLDTQWRWTYPQVISEFIPNTVRANIPLFEKYPNYTFNWTGANRYRMLKEYDPADYAILKEWIARGRWFTAGSSWEENDVNVPSSESLIRQILLGHDYFKKEFGTESCEYMLPDCFGFPASLPSVLAHCGLRGFSTQKLTWHSANGIPFDIGVWEGPDGQSIIAALNPGSYSARVRGDVTTSSGLLDRVNRHGSMDGIFTDYLYFGTGDTGGAPDEESVAWVEKSTEDTNGPLRVLSARSDQMFRAITDAEKAKLPRYKGDLLLTEHSAGSITSEAYMKRWNHENELLADEAERASVAAYLIGAAPYPREKLQHAWQLILGGQFHDLLPGTALPKAFEYSWNDEIIAMNSSAAALADAVGAVARALDTRADGGRPLVVFNPLSVEREDVAQAELDAVAAGQPDLPAGADVQVFDGAGNPVPTQLLSNDAGQPSGKRRILFLAKVPPIGFAVFTVKSSTKAPPSSEVKADEHSIENARYRVKLNDAGDIASVFDKSAGRELLFAPARLAIQTEFPTEWPAWNMEWKDRKLPPRGHVEGPATIKAVENGPVRAAIEVTRQAENSIFTQTIRLAAGTAGDRLEVANHVDWQSKQCCLKVEFPLTVTNELATYNWELGKIQRGNNEEKKFEVPSHQWFDLTDNSGNYGVSILTDYKYGSDKPADTLLRLTLLYTPGVTQPFFEQRWQDWGRHDFTYAIYGHTGDWRNGKSDWQAMRLGQPLVTFSTVPHEGKLGRSYSVLHLDSDQIAVRALKLAEDSDQVIVRLQELNGTNAGSVTLSANGGLTKAAEVNGVETPLHPLESHDPALKLDFTPYQLRSIALNLTAPAHLSAPVSTPLDLPYDRAGFAPAAATNDGGFDDNGDTMPAEMIGDTVVSEGITFKIGPHAVGQKNTVVCRGQTITLPAGPHNRVYLLAASAGGDTTGDFKVDGHAVTLGIQNWTGKIGSWDNRVFKGDVSELVPIVTNELDHIDSGFIKRDSLGWFCSHRHLADGSDGIYQYSYLFKYRLNISDDTKSLTLPDNPRIRVVAVSAAQDDNDSTVPVQPLYDDFTGRPPVTLRTEP